MVERAARPRAPPPPAPQTWTDCKGTPDNALSKDEMLTNICIYWFSGRITSSVRLYKETLANKCAGFLFLVVNESDQTGAFGALKEKPPALFPDAATNARGACARARPRRRSTERNSIFGGYVPTPCGVAVFPREILRPPKSWIRAHYNLAQYAEMPAGGHFAALEQPRLLFDEVVKFGGLARGRKWL